jgi:hypothetical protein
MQRLLRSVGARKGGEKAAAAAAISFLEARGLIVDTGRTKKPHRAAGSIARAEKFQKRGSIAHEGGKRPSHPLFTPTGGVSFGFLLSRGLDEP